MIVHYKIYDTNQERYVPCYFQFSGDQWEFSSIEEARNSNCHGMFKDKIKYRIDRFVNGDLDQENCDPPSELDFERKRKEDKEEKEIEEMYCKKLKEEGQEMSDFEKTNLYISCQFEYFSKSMMNEFYNCVFGMSQKRKQ